MAKEGTWLTTVDSAKSTKAPKSVVSEMSVDSAKSIKGNIPALLIFILIKNKFLINY